MSTPFLALLACADVSFTDIMMWAVLSGQHEIATLVWAKTQRPLRAAVLASQVCLRLSSVPQLRPDRDHLLEESIKYEELVVRLLDAVRESEDAFELLTLCPWDWSGGGERARWSSLLHVHHVLDLLLAQEAPHVLDAVRVELWDD